VLQKEVKKVVYRISSVNEILPAVLPVLTPPFAPPA
jgi:hypothetical protein